jgi:hypothetical protein
MPISDIDSSILVPIISAVGSILVSTALIFRNVVLRMMRDVSHQRRIDRENNARLNLVIRELVERQVELSNICWEVGTVTIALSVKDDTIRNRYLALLPPPKPFTEESIPRPTENVPKHIEKSPVSDKEEF